MTFSAVRKLATSEFFVHPSGTGLQPNKSQEPVPDSRCLGTGHLWASGQMPESEDPGSGRREGDQEQDGVLQSKHDGSVGPRPGTIKGLPPARTHPKLMPSAVE